jgi:hypothetical protein
MTWVATVVVGGNLIGDWLASDAQSDAADTAANAQTRASELGIAEQRRQFEEIQRLLAPYVGIGTEAASAQRNLLGFGGRPNEQHAIARLEGSPQFSALMKQGENALLQNASATGGLRGGNLQGALAQFRPNLLSQMIESQFSKLGQLSGLGQASAAGQAALGQQTGNNVAGLLSQMGAAQAGSALAAGQGQANMFGGIGNSIGQAIALRGLFGPGGTAGFNPATSNFDLSF